MAALIGLALALYLSCQNIRQGIEKSIINKELSLLKDMGGKGCALLGDPNHYKRFGLRDIPI
jgi:predicted N-acetyltransferase YhbS